MSSVLARVFALALFSGAVMGLRALLLLWACPLAVTQESTEKEYVELDDVTWTTALLLISFVIVSTGVLCLVKCKDEDIRKESWALLNVTLSIFCAASFDNAVCRLIETFSEEEGHEKPAFMSKPNLIVLFVFLCLVFVVLHLAFLCLIPQENHHVLFATQALGSHIMAFASIVFFGHLQMAAVSWKAVSSWGGVWLVPLLAFGVMVILYRMVLHLLRRFDNEWWKEKRLVMHQAMLMQIDAGGISVGFLIVQALCYSLIDESEPASSDASEPERRFMPITHGYPGHHKAYTELLLGLLALVLLCSSSVWSVCLRHMVHSEFFFEFIGVLGSSMACWCLQRGGIIFFYQKCKSRMNRYHMEVMCEYPHKCHGSHEMQPVQVVHRAVIVNALAMSLLAVVCMLVIDGVADFWQGKPCCPATHSTSYVAMVRPAPAGDLDVRTAKALRKVMSGLGLLVGICWDKAFESSYDTLLDPHTMSRLAFQTDTVNEFIQGYPKQAERMVAVLGFLVSALVGCAWFWHIVPSAMKEERDHEEAIKLETQSLQNIKLPGEKTPTWQSSSSSEPDLGCWQTDAESD
ncbi:unnamed protein product [Symbiodinium sp. CCMP2456]|nr:unnamed protein product [Symbiodinium sp. CCMP2456]